MLQGDKDKGTDVHSLTAKSVGLDRQNAKVLNYARLYGCGQTKAQVMLGGRNPVNSKMVEKLWKLTKGETAYRIVPEISDAMEDIRLMLDESNISPGIKKKFMEVYVNDLSGKDMKRLAEFRFPISLLGVFVFIKLEPY